MLRIWLLGDFRIELGDCECPIPVTKTARGLLAYLLLHSQRAHSREMLVDLFWGQHDHDHARSCLNTALWRLRSLLEPDNSTRGTYLETTSNGEIRFNVGSNLWLDAIEFQEKLSRLENVPDSQLTIDHLHEIEACLQLYKGDLLDGYYDEWVLALREQLRNRFLNAHTRLMAYKKVNGQYEQSLHHGLLILQHEPLREDIHREMMRLYALVGSRSLVERQYQMCRKELKNELGIEPMRETQVLYKELMNNEQPSRINTKIEESQDSSVYLLQQLIVTLSIARQQLDSATKLIDEIAKKQCR